MHDPTIANQNGFFPLPEDTAASYEARVAAISAWAEGRKAALEQPVPYAPSPTLLTLFDIAPAWVPVSYSSEFLRPWEAACSLAFDSVGVEIQLSPHFQKHQMLLGLYDRDEVMAHEYVHAVRAWLPASRYEEHFAYLTSRSCGPLGRLRSWLGPFFQAPWESLLLVALLALSVVANVTSWWWPELPIAAFLVLPVALLAVWCGRLAQTWRTFVRCWKNTRSYPLMVRLLDEEIERFAASSPEEIAAWVEMQKATSFRWQLLSGYLWRSGPAVR